MYYVNTFTKEVVHAPLGRNYCEKQLARQGKSGVLASDLPLITDRQRQLFFSDYEIVNIHVVACVPTCTRRHKRQALYSGPRPVRKKLSRNLAKRYNITLP